MGPRRHSLGGALRSTTTDNPVATEPGASSGDYAVDRSAKAAGAQPHVDLGIAPGDWSRWTNPAATAPETTAPCLAPAPVSTTGGLAEALEAHDQATGLGPAGAVLSAAREAAHTDVAPQLGTATFAVTVLRTGIVDVQLTGASSNVDGWQQVAASMAAAIKRKPPQIHPPRNGVRIGIALEAEERWPSGAVARTEGPSVSVTMLLLHAVDQAKEDLQQPHPPRSHRPAAPWSNHRSRPTSIYRGCFSKVGARCAATRSGSRRSDWARRADAIRRTSARRRSAW